MKTKTKLAFIVAAAGAILLLSASFLIWNSIATYRTVNRVTSSLEALAGIRDLQSSLHQQQYSLVHFAVSGEQDSLRNFLTSRTSIEENLARLSSLVPAQQPSGNGTRERLTGETVTVLMDRYARYRTHAESSIQLRRAGRTDETVRSLDIEITSFFDTELEPVLDQMDREGMQSIHDAYRTIAMRLGALPWISGSGMQQVERSISGVDYGHAVSNAELGLYRQVNELTEFLLYGKAADREEFLGYRFEMRRLFAEWQQVIQRQQTMGIEGEDDDAKQLVAVRTQYEKLLSQMEKTAAVRGARGRRAGLEYLEHTLKSSFTSLFSTMEGIGKESREEVRELHDGLLRTVVRGGAAGLTAMVLLSLLVLVLALRMSTGIVSSLASLKKGAEIIQGGDLEHHIVMPGDDEFGELATSFNAMSDSLKQRNDELRAFIFSIAHDLRAPLVNLKGFSSELRKDLAGVMPELMKGLASLKDDERQHVAAVLEQAVPEALGYIDSSTLRLDSLINAVLHLSRIDFRTLEPEVIDMEELVHTALETFAHTIKEKNLTVTRGPLPSVVADRMVMEQSMANILDNAFRYLEPGRAGVISIIAEQTKDEVIISITDNGRGIAPDDVQKVFEIFRRAGQQDTPGEGMGLAFVKSLIRRQGGTIRCESVLGEGSTFSLSLPADHGQRI